MRAMRLSKREVTDADGLRDILEACRTVRVGAVDEEGMFIVPMSYGYEWEDGDAGSPRITLWMHSATRGRKAEAFGAGGEDGVEVAFEMDRDDGVIEGDYACRYSLAYRSIMGTGTIRPVLNGEDKVYGLDLIMQHMAPDAPRAFGPGVLDRTQVWSLEVRSLTGKRRSPK